jgi:hypothetical protein
MLPNAIDQGVGDSLFLRGHTPVSSERRRPVPCGGLAVRDDTRPGCE